MKSLESPFVSFLKLKKFDADRLPKTSVAPQYYFPAPFKDRAVHTPDKVRGKDSIPQHQEVQVLGLQHKPSCNIWHRLSFHYFPHRLPIYLQWTPKLWKQSPTQVKAESGITGGEASWKAVCARIKEGERAQSTWRVKNFFLFHILWIKQKENSYFHLHAKERNYSKTNRRMVLAAPKHIAFPSLTQQEGADSTGMPCAMHLERQEREHISYGQG